MKRVRKLTVADFFAGIGGLGLGFKKAGFQIVYANDIDPYCCKTYKENIGNIDCGDIRTLDIDRLPNFDVLLAGFPCQPFSMAGKQKGLQDDRGQLFFQIVKILNAKRPQAFVLENVKHLKIYEDGAVLERMIKNLHWLGYTTYVKILNSKDFGVPQNRERLFIIGFLSENSPFRLNRRRKFTALANILETNVDEFFYISSRYYKGLLNHKSRHQKKGNGFGCRILDPGGIASTLVAGNMGRERNLIKDRPVKKNKMGIRRLTIRECARLQGFPDRFKFPVSNTKAYEQLGNAVTVPVAYAIGTAIKRSLLRAESTKSATASSGVLALTQFLPSKHQETTTTEEGRGAIVSPVF